MTDCSKNRKELLDHRILCHSGYSSLSQLIFQLNIAFFELCWLYTTKDTKARMKCHEILPAHIKTPQDTTHKIANRFVEFIHHVSTLQKNTFEQGCAAFFVNWDLPNPRKLLNWINWIGHCLWFAVFCCGVVQSLLVLGLISTSIELLVEKPDIVLISHSWNTNFPDLVYGIWKYNVHGSAKSSLKDDNKMKKKQYGNQVSVHCW